VIVSKDSEQLTKIGQLNAKLAGQQNQSTIKPITFPANQYSQESFSDRPAFMSAENFVTG
jgi:hypothetical protein